MDSSFVNRYLEEYRSGRLHRVSHRTFKQRLYPEFARVAQALASDRRLELIDLLAQAPRHVDALAQETGMSVANVSQHLQVLRAARLVEAEREGTKTRYRLAGPDVLRLWLELRCVAERRISEVNALAREAGIGGGTGEIALDNEVFVDRVSRGELTLIDVRPRLEFDSGHLPGAISMPIDELPERVQEIPPQRPVVAYCRGTYCLFAGEAVELLRSKGFEAVRLDGGWTEWSVAASRAEEVPLARNR